MKFTLGYLAFVLLLMAFADWPPRIRHDQMGAVGAFVTIGLCFIGLGLSQLYLYNDGKTEHHWPAPVVFLGAVSLATGLIFLFFDFSI